MTHGADAIEGAFFRVPAMDKISGQLSDGAPPQVGRVDTLPVKRGSVGWVYRYKRCVRATDEGANGSLRIARCDGRRMAQYPGRWVGYSVQNTWWMSLKSDRRGLA